METAWSVIQVTGKVTPLKGDKAESIIKPNTKYLPLLEKIGNGMNKNAMNMPQLTAA